MYQKGFDELLSKVSMMKTKKGTVTESQFMQQLQEDGKYTRDHFFCKWLGELKANNKIWIKSGDASEKHFPPLGTTEQDVKSPNGKKILGTQSFFDATVNKIRGGEFFTAEGKSSQYFSKKRKNMSIKLDPKSTCNIATFRRRKPDHTVFREGLNGEFAIVFIGEIKSRYNGSFTAAHMGQIIDTCIDLYEIQIERSYVICFLSDGYRFQFFKVSFVDGEPNNVAPSDIYTGVAGWQVKDYHVLPIIGFIAFSSSYDFNSIIQ